MSSARETVRGFFLSGQDSVLREIRMNDSDADLFLPYPEWKRNDKMYSRMPRHFCCEIRVMQSMTYFFCTSYAILPEAMAIFTEAILYKSVIR